MAGAATEAADPLQQSVEPKTTAAKLPLTARLYHAMVVFAIQRVLMPPARAVGNVYEFFYPPENRPDEVKIYGCRPGLSVRIFFPKAQPEGQLPLLLTIHGGGFVLGEPKDNDDWNAAFASEHNALVVALNYRKAPSHPFPTALHDIEALVAAVLADPALSPRIDRTRVGLLGWSAGGNLALAAAQQPSVRAVVTAVVPIYPVVDFAVPLEIKARTRRYKPQLGGFRAAKKDYLSGLAPTFDWAYSPVGQDVRHPLLSPYYAEKADLPSRVFIVGCEMDLLAHEAWRLACKLTGKEIPGLEQPVGRGEPGKPSELSLDDDRFYFKMQDGSSDVRWLLVPDTVHGFDQKIEAIVRDPVLMEDARAKTRASITLIGDWLFKEE